MYTLKVDLKKPLGELASKYLVLVTRKFRGSQEKRGIGRVWSVKFQGLGGHVDSWF